MQDVQCEVDVLNQGFFFPDYYRHRFTEKKNPVWMKCYTWIHLQLKKMNLS